VLCYLAVAEPRGWQARDQLIALFWPELDEAHARNALNQAVHFLRRRLAPDAILARADELACNNEVLRCDALEMERLIDDSSLEQALALYQGDFLTGFHVADAPEFEHWLDQRRAHFRSLAGTTAKVLAGRRRSAGDLAGALEFARRASELARYDEQYARTVLDLLVEAGQSALALSFFDEFAARVAELDLQPSAALRTLVAGVRTTNSSTALSGSPAARTFDLETQLRVELTPELEIVRLLGRGSMAIVYLARDPVLKRLVVVKALRPQLAADSIARQRFEREGEAAARIAHRNVAVVHRIGRLQAGLPYLVVEYIDGRSLAEMLSACGSLPYAEARPVLLAIAAALAAAHDQGVVHRDLRPANVFIENRSGRVVLTDFGIAALSESGQQAAHKLTPLGQLLGDVSYASPEQLRGEPVSGASDIYSLGVIALETLNGNAAPTASFRNSQMPRTEAVTWNSGVPLETRTLVERCLSQDPALRPRAHDISARL
jgi:DNA-binding SARP family transcriptional activator/tRNA A-37 threonylcarbamoyl transferase component Bud32